VTCFLDTSAIVKLFVPELGHELVDTVAKRPIIAADIALVELPAALHRKARMGELSPRLAQLLTRAFRASADSTEGPDLHLIETTVPVLVEAARLVARHPLRAYDAVQLASALASNRAVPGCSFGSFDQQLNDAAFAEGLVLAF